MALGHVEIIVTDDNKTNNTYIHSESFPTEIHDSLDNFEASAIISTLLDHIWLLADEYAQDKSDFAEAMRLIHAAGEKARERQTLDSNLDQNVLRQRPSTSRNNIHANQNNRDH